MDETVGTVTTLSRFPSSRCRVFGFTITHGKIVEIELIADPARLSQLDLAVLDD